MWGGVGYISSCSCIKCDLYIVNPNDFENVGAKKPKDMQFEARFDGITLHMAHRQSNIVFTQVSGFSVKGKTEAEVLSVTARYVQCVYVYSGTSLIWTSLHGAD